MTDDTTGWSNQYANGEQYVSLLLLVRYVSYKIFSERKIAQQIYIPVFMNVFWSADRLLL